MLELFLNITNVKEIHVVLYLRQIHPPLNEHDMAEIQSELSELTKEGQLK